MQPLYEKVTAQVRGITKTQAIEVKPTWLVPTMTLRLSPPGKASHLLPLHHLLVG